MTTSLIIAAATVCGLGIVTAFIEECVRKPPVKRPNQRPEQQPAAKQSAA